MIEETLIEYLATNSIEYTHKKDKYQVDFTYFVQGNGFGECGRCRTREARDRQCAADIGVVVAAAEAGQTCRGILVEHLHVVTAKTGFDAFAIHSMVCPCDGYDACSRQQADPCRSAGGH